MFFCFAFKNTGICSVLCISGRKSIGIYSIFCFFASLPHETSKRINAVIYSILWLSKSQNLSKNAPCWANLGPFWGSCWTILTQKIENIAKPQNAVKRTILEGRRQGAPAFLLRRRSKAYGCAMATRGPGAPGRIEGLAPDSRPGASCREPKGGNRDRGMAS